MLTNIMILAFREIRRNMLRSILTTLGIVIGVAAVVAITTLGAGTKQQVEAEISKLGATMLTIYPGQSRRRGGVSGSARLFDIDDVNAIRREAIFLSSVAPLSLKTALVVHGNNNRRSQITGTSSDFLKVRDWQIYEGRGFTIGEERGGKPVCIIGETIRKELFGLINPISQLLRLGNASCQVIGLLEPKGQVMFAGDQDDVVLVPLNYFQRRISGKKTITSIYVAANTESVIEQAKAEITAIMQARRPSRKGADALFSIRGVQEMSDALQSSTAILTGFLSAIAAISLVVGGVGIMNIMLVSVTERTREIGIRMAIGAREPEVLLQFLVEATMLSGMGGLIGIAFGMFLTLMLAPLINVPFIFQIDMVLVAFLFSCIIGIIFGYMPARRAARLNPIDALRHE